MQIALHLGLHCTNADMLAKALARNAPALRKSGTLVPPPARYRPLLSDAVERLGDATPAPDARAVLLDAILAEDQATAPRRLVLSHENLLAGPRGVFEYARPYPRTEQRLRAVGGLLGPNVALYFGLRNPATFLPAMLARSGAPSLDALTGGMPPAELSWAPVIAAARAAVPDAPITVWCMEDTALIWGEVVRAVAGLPSGTKIAGAFDMLASVMAPEGMRRFRAYLAQNPTITEAQKRRVMTTFLDKYADESAMEQVLDLPGWTDETVALLSDLYDADIEDIAQINGVTVLAP